MGMLTFRRRRERERLSKEKQNIQNDFENMTIKELKEYAKENEIDLGNAKKKADIIVIIQGTAKNPDEEKDSTSAEKAVESDTDPSVEGEENNAGE